MSAARPLVARRGLALSLLAGRVLHGLRFNVTPRDPVMLASVGGICLSATRLPPEKVAKLSQQNLPGRLVREQEMIAARQRNEPRSSDVCCEQAPLVERDRGVAFAMKDDRGHLDVGEPRRGRQCARTLP